MPDNLGAIARARPHSQSEDSNEECGSTSDDDDDSEDDGDDDSNDEDDQEGEEKAEKLEDEDFMPADEDWISEQNFDQKAVTNFGLGGNFM